MERKLIGTLSESKRVSDSVLPRVRTDSSLYDREGETALMMALAPDTVDMARVAEGDPWYTETAPKATAATGQGGVAIALAHLRQVLGLE